MLHIILLILKILGIILLSILALAVLILCAVLFAAVTYRVKVEKKETLQVSAVGGWLFHALSVHYMLDQAQGWKQELKIKVFGITILNPFEEKKPKKKKKKRAEKKPENKERMAERPDGDAAVPAIEEKADAGRTEEPPSPSDRPLAALPELTEFSDEQPGKGKKPSIIERIRQFFSKLLYAIRGFCDKIKETGRNLHKTVQDLKEKKDSYLEFWNLEEHRTARSAIYRELRYLWKKSRPRRIEGYVRFGFDDPSRTGMCMGALSILYAWYPKKFQLIPDFEHEILEGKLLIKGRIRLYVAALILWRVWFNKNIRHMYEHWQEL